MDLELKGHAVLVTGGSRGIGRDIALGFAREGALVAICARDQAQLDATRSEITALGATCHTIAADLGKAEDCRRVVDDTARRFGRLDVLVNNASTSVDKTPNSLEDATDTQLLERVLGKTMVAIRCSRAALGYMRRAGGGRIVMIGGMSARTVIRGEESMSAGSGLPQGLGNASLANFTKFLSEEAAADKIAVNIVHPHFTYTGRYPARLAKYAAARGISETEAEERLISHMPMGRFVYPSDITPIVLLFGSPLVGIITGQSIAVDGGATRAIAY
jgi:3-oxoacyl-[acyl-carrier protein] reductase